MKMKLTGYLGTLAILLAIWLGLLYRPVFGGSALPVQGIILGAVVAAGIALMAGRFFAPPLAKVFSPRRWFWALVYIPYFFWYCLMANFDVLYRVLHPQMPINPGIVRVTTGLKSRAAITALANSITLTPGTLTVDLTVEDEGETMLYIHWINVRSRDKEEATGMIVKRFERILKRIFE